MIQGQFALSEPDSLPASAPDRSPERAAELALARLTLELGATSAGGPLSREEAVIVADAATLPAPDPAELLRTRDAILSGADPLGQTLCRLRPAVERRDLGAFYTQPGLVTPMVDWVLERRPDRVVDPGCGSGRFTAAAVHARPDLQILAIDVDPLATLLTRATLAVLGCRNAHVVQCDYTRMDLPRIPGRTAFVGNPPYVRHHTLSPEVKAWAAATARRFGTSVSGLAGLHALFFLATALHAQTGDIGCFITSAEWLDVNYGSLIRDLLADGLGGISLDVLRPEAVAFDDAMTTAAIAAFQVGSEPDRLSIRLAESARDLSVLGRGRSIEFTVLKRARRWSTFLYGRTGGDPASGLAPLGSVARVHRGVVTGANDFFVLTREQARERGIERWCRPAITSAREIFESGGVVRDGPERRLLLELPRGFDRTAAPSVDAYLKTAEQPASRGSALSERYIPRHRRPWWYLGKTPRPPIVATYMARQAPFFALNPDGLALINIGHGVYPTAPLSESRLEALVRALNTARTSFIGGGRTYHGGLEKFEPREMESLLVPAALFQLS